MTSTYNLDEYNVFPDKVLASNWNATRNNYNAAVAAFDAGNPGSYHCFLLPANCPLTIPSNCVVVHGYLLYDDLSKELSLFLISDVDDLLVSSGSSNVPASQVYTAAYEACTPPASLSVNYQDRIDRWQNNKNPWLQSVIAKGTHNLEESVVRVFDIPASDLRSVLGAETQIYMALQDAHLEESSVEIIFYKDDSTQRYYDFTSPRPPFGGSIKDYGMIT